MAFKRCPFQLNEEFAGMPVVFIKTYSGLLSGCQLAHVKHSNGERYRVFRWPDGQIFNVRRINRLTTPIVEIDNRTLYKKILNNIKNWIR